MHNNPAARLYNLVRRLRSTSSNGPPAGVWAAALDIPINQEMTGLLFTQVVQGILAFLDLVDEIEAGLDKLAVGSSEILDIHSGIYEDDAELPNWSETGGASASARRRSRSRS